MTRTFLAMLQYDGRDFVGWQRQAVGRSVQGEFEAVLERLCGMRVPAVAAGRTDAGVHALALGVSFELPEQWNASGVRRALNALLPADCWVAAVHPMVGGFNARRSALERRYRYDVGTDAACQSPFRHRWEWALARKLDIEALAAAARGIHGEHDFRAFAVRGPEKPHWRCRVRVAEWELRNDGAGVRFHIAADRFLHHMVRMLVGTMIDAGLGRRPPDDIARLLTSIDNQETSPPAPPQGLYFVAADYPPECFAAETAADAESAPSR